DQRTAGIDVVWADEKDGAVALYATSCGPDGRPRTGTPKRLLQRSAPLLAWNLEPYSASARGEARALFGPQGDDQKVTYVRAAIDGSSPAHQAHLPPLPTELKHPLQSWAISGLDSGPMRAAASANGQIWTASASGGVWMKLADAPNTRELHLVETPY